MPAGYAGLAPVSSPPLFFGIGMPANDGSARVMPARVRAAVLKSAAPPVQDGDRHRRGDLIEVSLGRDGFSRREAQNGSEDGVPRLCGGYRLADPAECVGRVVTPSRLRPRSMIFALS